jgi:hypothetical protein
MHAFLAETDPAGRYLEWTGLADPEGEFPHYRAGALRTSVARPDRLLFAYRLRERWIEREHQHSTAPR